MRGTSDLDQLDCSLSINTYTLLITVPAGAPQLESVANTLTVDDIAEFLKKIKLGHLAGLFSENDVNGALLIELSDDDLKDLGIENGFQRRKIISMFKKHLLELVSK